MALNMKRNEAIAKYKDAKAQVTSDHGMSSAVQGPRRRGTVRNVGTVHNGARRNEGYVNTVNKEGCNDDGISRGSFGGNDGFSYMCAAANISRSSVGDSTVGAVYSMAAMFTTNADGGGLSISTASKLHVQGKEIKNFADAACTQVMGSPAATNTGSDAMGDGTRVGVSVRTEATSPFTASTQRGSCHSAERELVLPAD